MRTKVTLLLSAAALAVALLLAISPPSGGSSPTARASATKNVSIEDNFFSPKRINISRGGKVVWRWKGFSDHNVRFRSAPSGAKRPKGSPTKSSGRFARTFSRRGTYRFVCTIHESSGMKGRVVVH
jgi:plastocyanin